MIEKGSHFIVINWTFFLEWQFPKKLPNLLVLFTFFAKLKTPFYKTIASGELIYVYPPADHLRNMQKNAFRHTIN